MNRIVSPYYPRRARWYSPLFRLWHAARRRTGLDQLHLPDNVPLVPFLASLFVPGLAFLVRKERLIGRAIVLSYGLLTGIFIVWLGYPIANAAFGLMLAAHVTSISFLLQTWLADARLGFRFAIGILLLVVVGGGIYAPLRQQLQTRYLMPLRINNQVVIVQTFSSTHSVRRGDWINYSLAGGGQNGVRVNQGLGLRPVLAVAGDYIRFTPDRFEINGIGQPRLPHMPTTGEMRVPENHWFLWPEIVVSGNGNATEVTIANTMVQLATVAETKFIGKPFKRWFWRRQFLS